MFRSGGNSSKGFNKLSVVIIISKRMPSSLFFCYTVFVLLEKQRPRESINVLVVLLFGQWSASCDGVSAVLSMIDRVFAR